MTTNSSTSTSATTTTDRELVITRVFDAPRSLVFKVWTDNEHLKHWATPIDMTTSFAESDIRPGGTFRVCMRSPDGTEFCARGTYREIVEPERIVFTHAWEEDEGRPGHETVVTITFEDLGNKTKLTLHQAFFTSVESRDGHTEGWNSQLDNLAKYLARTR